ncbi:MAG: ribonuclease J [Bacillota bacterium]
MSKHSKQNDNLQLVPLGGVGEIGKNMFTLKYRQECIVLDAGLKFPEEGMHGVDIVIPDTTYLLENQELIKGIILTHGHEDHIGALPYLAKDLSVPVYGTKLTLGMLQSKMTDHESLRDIEMREINPDQILDISPSFKLEFFRTNHSIPDSVGVAVHTPVGSVVYTSDFKFDQTPVDGRVTDFYKLADLGRRGVLAALIDCTNADRPGYTLSEKEVGKTIDDIFRLSGNRIIFATFASNIHRIQQVITAAHRYNRKVCVIGRSIVSSVEIASQLGYLNIPAGILVELDQINHIPHEQLALITTGSQGEPMSALTRISLSDHRRVEIVPGDTVIIAATPIPGNEKLVARTVNNLFERGAEVIYRSISGIHVSGHASEEEIKLMVNLLRPRYLIPVHGEYRHQTYCAKIAVQLDIPADNVFLVEPGTVIEFAENSGRIAGMVTAGKIMVDGLGVGDVGDVVLRDRRILAEEGILIVILAIDTTQARVISGPDIVTRGFVYVRESEELLEEAKQAISKKITALKRDRLLDWNVVKSNVREAASSFFFEKTGRRPMIMPIIIELDPTVTE